MATYYIDSNASGLNDGSDPTNAYSDVATALVGKLAGDVFYTSHLHAYIVGAAITYALPASTKKNPVVFISCDFATTPPTTFTYGASEAAVGSFDMTIGNSGGKSAVFIGFEFSSGQNLWSVDTDCENIFFDCLFSLAGTATWTLYIGDNDTSVYMENCQFKFSHVGQQLKISASDGQAILGDCSIASGSTAITGTFISGSSGGLLRARGLDLSNAAAGVDLIAPVTSPTNAQFVASLVNVKMPAGWSGSIVSATAATVFDTVEAYNVDDDSDTIYQVYIDMGLGTVRSESTTVHTGTYDGTGKYSLQVINIPAPVATSQPMFVKIGSFWADANPTLLINITSDDTLTDQEFWIGVEAPSVTAGSLSNFFRSRDADYFLGTGAPLATGGGWTAPKTNQYEITQAVTGSQGGVHTVYANLAAVTAKTVYVDTFVVVT